MNIYVINGPNINLLGTREPEIYGKETLESISKACQEKASKVGHSVKFMQSNYEGEIVEWIQDAIINKVDAIVINAAAYTHTSIAIHDASLIHLKCIRLPEIKTAATAQQGTQFAPAILLV